MAGQAGRDRSKVLPHTSRDILDRQVVLFYFFLFQFLAFGLNWIHVADEAIAHE